MFHRERLRACVREGRGVYGRVPIDGERGFTGGRGFSLFGNVRGPGLRGTRTETPAHPSRGAFPFVAVTHGPITWWTDLFRGTTERVDRDGHGFYFCHGIEHHAGTGTLPASVSFLRRLSPLHAVPALHLVTHEIPLDHADDAA